MNTPPGIRILLVDDHFLVRMGLSGTINAEQDMTVVAEAENGREALSQFRRFRPDVTLMDLRLPGMDGIQATGAIRAEHPDARVIVLSTYDGDEDIHRALEAGAAGYLLKEIQREDLLRAIREVHAGQSCLPQAVAARLAQRPHGCALTGRELEVLERIVRGMNNRQNGDALSITEGTVKTHVNSILSKLFVADRTQAAVAAISRGIVRLK
jgi:two-component system NarL family response regulator